jgi:hypothetical protein
MNRVMTSTLCKILRTGVQNGNFERPSPTTFLPASDKLTPRLQAGFQIKTETWESTQLAAIERRSENMQIVYFTKAAGAHIDRPREF